MNTPLVTVILPCYDGAGTVREAVESVWVQGRDDVELVAIDDCSTDDTLEVLREAAAESPIPMRVVANASNQLTARSINAVYPSASRYVTILHQDDKYPSGRFDDQLRMLERDAGLQIVYANGVNFTAEGVLGPLHDDATEALLASDPRAIETYLREHQNPIFLQPAIMRRELLGRIDGFDEQCMSDDWVTNIRIFSALRDGAEFAYLDDSVYLRRKHGENFHRNQRTMSVLRMEVLQAYATTERRQTILAEHYAQQAGYLTRFEFQHHAVAMMTLAALHHAVDGDAAAVERAAASARAAAAALTTRDDEHIGALLESVIGEGPSVEGLRRVATALRDIEESAHAARVDEAAHSMASSPLVPAGRPRPGEAVEQALELAERSLAVLGFRARKKVQSLARARWEHYDLLEMLRYDLARRGRVA